MTERDAEIAAYYAANRDDLLHTVDRVVIAAPTIIEDACQFAWMQLVRREDIVLDRGGFWWLHRVAVREAWRLTRYTRHVLHLGDVAEMRELGAIPSAAIASVEDLQQTIERRELIALVDQLPTRERRYVFMRAMGLTYAEMSRATGDSIRTVERQLRSAYATLRSLQAPLD